MAFCEQCGNKINDTAKFCGKCGTPVSSGQTEAQAEIPQTGVSANEESPAQKAFNAGMACLEADQYNEAIAHFTEAIRHKPDSAGAYYQRGYAHSLLEQYDAAIADLTAALPNTNDKAAFYFARGYNYYKSRQYGSAIADLDQAIRLNPNEAKYYGTRGSAYLENGDTDSAYADCERGLQIDPNEETLINLAHAIDEADEQDGMSAPTATPSACAQCGAPLEEGEMFCANCGAKVGAVPQYQPAPTQKVPAQTQGQAGGGYVLREGSFSINNSDAGKLLLYKDRLEWRGEQTTIVIPICEISSVKLSWATYSITIKMVNTTKYVLDKKRFFKVDRDGSEKREVESWFKGINRLLKSKLA
jgi:tetratricopeptide (TPR) repeat protein